MNFSDFLLFIEQKKNRKIYLLVFLLLSLISIPMYSFLTETGRMLAVKYGKSIVEINTTSENGIVPGENQSTKSLVTENSDDESVTPNNKQVVVDVNVNSENISSPPKIAIPQIAREKDIGVTGVNDPVKIPIQPINENPKYPCTGQIDQISGVNLNHVHLEPTTTSPSKLPVEGGAIIRIKGKIFRDGKEWYEIFYTHNSLEQRGWVPTHYVKPSSNCPKN